MSDYAFTNKVVNDDVFVKNYTSFLGKAFRNLDKNFAKYFGEPSEELCGMMVTPTTKIIGEI